MSGGSYRPTGRAVPDFLSHLECWASEAAAPVAASAHIQWPADDGCAAMFQPFDGAGGSMTDPDPRPALAGEGRQVIGRGRQVECAGTFGVSVRQIIRDSHAERHRQ